MHALDVRNDPATLEHCSLDGLGDLAADLHQAWPELPQPLLLHWSDHPILAVDGDRPWLYGPIERDPTARRGRVVVPRAQRKLLRAFALAGFPAQRIASAHELDPHGPVADLLPRLQHSPRTCTDAVARAVVGPVPPHPAVARAARVLDSIVRSAGRVVTDGLEVALDPIIFAVVSRVRPAHGEPCLFYPLSAWRW